MEIHLSPEYSKIEVVKRDNDAITVQCGLWPSWNELQEATREKLSSTQLDDLEALFRSDDFDRDFEIENEVLKIRFGQASAI
jgi:hypothetical protein